MGVGYPPLCSFSMSGGVDAQLRHWVGGYRYLLWGARGGGPNLAIGGVETIEERCEWKLWWWEKRHVSFGVVAARDLAWCCWGGGPLANLPT